MFFVYSLKLNYLQEGKIEMHSWYFFVMLNQVTLFKNDLQVTSLLEDYKFLHHYDMQGQ